MALSSTIYAQQKSESISNGAYSSPLDFPLSLSANFGEIRTTHFHSGVDFKSGGVVGKRVLSVADGYISRISVSPTGYGKAIYISHPELGTMSVYGHLDSFRDDVAAYVETIQYKNRRFTQNLFLPKELFTVKKGEFIALSGNSGSSGGPHLHFEIRDGATSATLSPLKVCGYGEKIVDNIPPKILSVNVVGLDENYGIPIHLTPKEYKTTPVEGGNFKIVGDTIILERDSYLAFEVTERKNNTTNIYGVTSMSLSCDGEEIWGYEINSLSFDYGRAINSFVLFPHTTFNRNDYIRTYIAPENRLKIYSSRKNEGVIYRHELITPKNFTLKASDEFGNSSEVSFVVRSCGEKSVDPILPPEGDLVLAGKFHTQRSGCSKLQFEPRTLQQSAYFQLRDSVVSGFPLSPIVTLKGSELQPPFNNSAKLAIKVGDGVEASDLSKLVICWIDDKGRLVSVGGKYSNGYVEASITGTGDYVVVKDDISPTIEPCFNDGELLSSLVKVKIDDDISGISTYNGYIDGEWVLFEYDPKNRVLLHKLSSKRTAKGVSHICKIVVSDKVGNSSSLSRFFK